MEATIEQEAAPIVKAKRGRKTVKRYSVIEGGPEVAMREKSVGTAILRAIQAAGEATAADVQRAVPETPNPTVRFYLGKFQRLGAISAQ